MNAFEELMSLLDADSFYSLEEGRTTKKNRPPSDSDAPFEIISARADTTFIERRRPTSTHMVPQQSNDELKVIMKEMVRELKQLNHLQAENNSLLNRLIPSKITT